MWETFCKALNINDQILSAIQTKLNFTQITKVQNITIREFLKNRDVVVNAITGSGKTLSYIIPLLQKLIDYSTEHQSYQNEILSLILLPTRELALQVYDKINIFISQITSFTFHAQLFIGGKDRDKDIELLNQQVPNIIIATPGRLLDVDENTHMFKFANLQVLIIDEADRMLETESEVKVTQIISRLPKQRRTGLFSATIKINVSNLIKAGMTNPFYIKITQHPNESIFISQKQLYQHNIGERGRYYTISPFTAQKIVTDTSTSTTSAYANDNTQNVPEGLNQFYIEVSNIKYKIPHLINLIYTLYNSPQNTKIKIMLFVCTCNQVDYFMQIIPHIFDKLKITEYTLYKLHSKISQNKRDNEYIAFSAVEGKRLRLLISTDLAARGIDIPDVDMIIQFDPPKTENSYIHKAGRTARVGKQGVSLLFLMSNETAFITYMKEQKQITLNKFTYIANDNKEEQMNIINNVNILQCIKEKNLSDKWVYDKAVNSFVSYLEFYKNVELNYLFDFRKLDIGNLANMFQLIKMPRIKMKEFQMESIANFEGDCSVTPKDLVYLDKNIEKQMMIKKEKINEKVNEIRLKKENEKKEMMMLHKGKNHEKRRTRKEKKEAKLKAIIDDWDDLADDDNLYKKYKKGKISKEEYEKSLLKIK